MNYTSRTDENILLHPTWNQNPPPLTPDLTTRQDFNGIVNAREQRDHTEKGPESFVECNNAVLCDQLPAPGAVTGGGGGKAAVGSPVARRSPLHFLRYVSEAIAKYFKFVGPGFMIAVAYIDPGNYATDVSAGAETKFALLFIVFASNLIAILLQSLCIKLGSVTGLDLAQNCRAHFPRWLVIIIYIFAEAAIIVTDISEVIGAAISLNLLFQIPLVAGCFITLADTLLIIFFYRPTGSMIGLRVFESFIVLLVLGVAVCFCIQLSFLRDTTVGQVFRGYLPSAAVVQGNGLYLSCGIIGATVMPHSLFLGSGLVQARLREFDRDKGHLEGSEEDDKYQPSISAIQHCLTYSIIELSTSLFTFALFINSAILIVAGAALYGNPDAGNADLFGIYQLLSETIAPIAGTIFALALLLSGTSAGIICTMAGQMVSEGMLNWSIAPWKRRLITRSISIVPSVIVAGAVGRDGLDTTLNATQVALSVILPIVSAPLVYFTARNKYMTVPGRSNEEPDLKMANNWLLSVISVLVWLLLVVLNVALLVLVGIGG